MLGTELRPLEEQQVLISAEPSLQSLFLLFTVCIYYRAGEMAWPLRRLTTIVKDLDLFPKNYSLTHNHLRLQFQGIQCYLFRPPQAPGMNELSDYPYRWANHGHK